MKTIPIAKAACDYAAVESLAAPREPPNAGMESCEFEGMVTRSPLMREMFAQICRVAPYYRACVVTGPTGTGKELVAHALHQLSPVAAGPWVVCNCSAVVETLFESELFGHAKGAFTGASSDKMGLFEHAHGGTLFLDEIGDMPFSIQAKLLRVLQSHEVQRVGSVHSRKVNVRVLAATNRDLRALMAGNGFREDLYYRLSMVEIRTPALAEHQEDLPLLEAFLMRKFASQYGKNVAGLSALAQIVLARHSWPGNVRELENVIGYACMIASGDTIEVADLPRYMREDAGRKGGEVIPFPEPGGSELSFDQQERRVIREALDRASGNQCRAARLLSISRDKLRHKIKKYNLWEGASHLVSPAGCAT